MVMSKQLTRRFAKWNSRKNIKVRERRAVFEAYSGASNISRAHDECGKITAKKLARYGKEADFTPKLQSELYSA